MSSSPFAASLTLDRILWQCLNWLTKPAYLMFGSAAFLVTVPVFFQAPLVRYAPWVSLVLTIGWFGLSLHLISERSTHRWGSLLYGFALTWLAGSLYWGWLRTEPLWHLPIEAIGLPIAIWGLRRGFAPIGNFFYLGSLLGTAITDLYIHVVGLLPHWRQVMQVGDFAQAGSAFQEALLKIQTLWGISWAIVLCLLLLGIGLGSLRLGRMDHAKKRLHWWVFSGAVLSTLVVDSLFWVVAVLLAD